MEMERATHRRCNVASEKPVAVPASWLVVLTTGSLKGASLIATGNLSLVSGPHVISYVFYKLKVCDVGDLATCQICIPVHGVYGEGGRNTW